MASFLFAASSSTFHNEHGWPASILKSRRVSMDRNTRDTSFRSERSVLGSVRMRTSMHFWPMLRPAILESREFMMRVYIFGAPKLGERSLKMAIQSTILNRSVVCGRISSLIGFLIATTLRARHETSQKSQQLYTTCAADDLEPFRKSSQAANDTTFMTTSCEQLF